MTASAARPLRFGLGISNCRPPHEVADLVLQAETAGAEIAFVAEDVNCRDAFSLLTLAAMKTDTIRLSTGVVNPYTRNPTSLAMAIATLDEVSGGRAQLGLGTGSPDLIAGQMGLDRGSPEAVMRETTHVLRGLLAGEVVSLDGDRLHYSSASLEVQPVQARVPIVFAAMGPRMLRLAGTVADGVLLNVGASVEYVRWAVEQVHFGARVAARDPADITIYAWITVYITGNRADGLRRAREFLATMLSIPGQGELLLDRSGLDTAILAPIRGLVHAYPHGGNRAEAANLVPDAVAERLTVVGNEDEVRTRLRQYHDAGVEVAVLGPGALQRAIRH